MKKYILVETRKQKNQDYLELIEVKLKEEFKNLEYGDVFEEQYQVWEYPSGKIFLLTPSRSMPRKDYYAPPGKDRWEVIMKYTKTDKKKVTEAYEKLFSMRGEPEKKWYQFWK